MAAGVVLADPADQNCPAPIRDEAELVAARAAQRMLLADISVTEPHVVDLFRARDYALAMLVPQKIYAIELAVEKGEPLNDVYWHEYSADAGDQANSNNDTLEVVLGRIGIPAYRPIPPGTLTSAAMDFLVRANRLARCTEHERTEIEEYARQDAAETDTPGVLPKVPLIGDLYRAMLARKNHTTDIPLIKRIAAFLYDIKNARDWILLARLVDSQQHDDSTQDVAQEIGDSITAYRNSSAAFRNAFQRRQRTQPIQRKLADPGYLRMADLGRPLPQHPTRIAPNGNSRALQDQYELRENLDDYDEDIRNLLLYRLELVQCAEVILTSERPLAERIRLICHEKLAARSRSIGLRMDVDKSLYEAFLERTRAMYLLEDARKIGHGMVDYAARRKLFLSELVNAPDWAALIQMRLHRVAEQARLERQRNFETLVQEDPLLGDVIRHADLQKLAFSYALTELELVKEPSYYLGLAADFRRKLGKLIAYIKAHDDSTVAETLLAGTNETSVEDAVNALSRFELRHLTESLGRGPAGGMLLATPQPWQRAPEWLEGFWQVEPPPMRHFWQTEQSELQEKVEEEHRMDEADAQHALPTPPSVVAPAATSTEWEQVLRGNVQVMGQTLIRYIHQQLKGLLDDSTEGLLRSTAGQLSLSYDAVRQTSVRLQEVRAEEQLISTRRVIARTLYTVLSQLLSN
jgi:hypothetical protein